MLDFAKMAASLGLFDLRSLKKHLNYKLPDHENPLNDVSFMSLALYVLYL